MREICGFPTYYITQEGEVYHQRWTGDTSELVKLNPYPRDKFNPQPTICLYANGVVKQVFIKDIVFLTFVGPIPRGGYVAYIDGNINNPSLNNLTLKLRQGHIRPHLPQAIPIKMYRHGKPWGVAETKSQCASIIGISRTSVDNILNNRITFRRCYLERESERLYALWFNGQKIARGTCKTFMKKYHINEKIMDKQLQKGNYFQKEWRICT